MVSKKKEIKKYDAGMTTMSLGMASVGCLACMAAVFLPYWTVWGSAAYLSWQQRYFGLLKVGGQFSNPLTTVAEMTWMYMKTQVCYVAFARNGVAGMNGATAAAQLLTAAAGIHCPAPCMENLMVRCKWWRIISFANFAIMAAIILGALIAVTGAVFPTLGKE